MLESDIKRLNVRIAGLNMKTPVTTGSGTFGFGLEFEDFLDLNAIGAICVKGTSLKASSGNPGVRIAETPSGLLNSIGLENPGVDWFLRETLPKLRRFEAPVIVNIYAHSVEDFARLAEKLNVEGVSALEINISCPNVREGGLAFGVDPEMASGVVRAVKEASEKTVITKLTPNVTDVTEIALAVDTAGTDAISMINTLLGMKIDIRRKKPVLGNIKGGLSGPAIRPVALRQVYDVAQCVSVPIIGMGGIVTAEDAVEFLLAGASAVAVGTANFMDPGTAETISEGLIAYLDKNRFSSIEEIVGLALPEGKDSMPYYKKKRNVQNGF